MKTKEWKIYNSDPKTWERMVKYYKWCASIFCFIFALVLFVEKIWILGLSMLIYAWLVNPSRLIRKYDVFIEKQKNFIKYGNLILTIIGIYFVVDSITKI